MLQWFGINTGVSATNPGSFCDGGHTRRKRTTQLHA